MTIDEVQRREMMMPLADRDAMVVEMPTTVAPGVVLEVTCSAPVNIAVIKYWGKRDTKLLLPTNSSLSVTLSQDHLQSKTTVRVGTPPDVGSDVGNENALVMGRDHIWLNGREEDVSAKRLANVIGEVRRIRRAMEEQDSSLPRLSSLPIHIASVNNFPTAAGLASSASGFACLTFALANLFSLPLTVAEVSRLARVGSGSACRSLFGGFVAWDMGSRADGTDSVAVQVAPDTHWPNMVALILVASDAKKHTGSTEGMQLTVETSPLLKERIENVVPQRMSEMTRAIEERDFDTFAEITMRDSNQFHAVCLDTFPPIFYLTDVSRAVINFITQYNRAAAALEAVDNVPQEKRRSYRVAYTFDAGPNAVLYMLEEDAKEVMALVNEFFPRSTSQDSEEYFGRASDLLSSGIVSDRSRLIKSQINAPIMDAGCLKRVIYTRVGDGPRVLATSNVANVSLLNKAGLPF